GFRGAAPARGSAQTRAAAFRLPQNLPAHRGCDGRSKKFLGSFFQKGTKPPSTPRTSLWKNRLIFHTFHRVFNSPRGKVREKAQNRPILSPKRCEKRGESVEKPIFR
ncbi:MAG: hypothetical protein ACI4LE_00145, partial [Faecalibacterium sp.]